MTINQNNPNQQGKPHQPAANAPQANLAPTNATVGDAGTTQIEPETPNQRAKRFVAEVLAFFDEDSTSISRQVSQHVTAAVANCPVKDLADFRSDGRKRAERLKQFSEMLMNEFVYQTATKG